jgi:putative heme-binding domain-containing protein
MTSLTGNAGSLLAALVGAGPPGDGRQALIREVCNLIGTGGDEKEVGEALLLLSEAAGEWQLPSFRELLEPLKPGAMARWLDEQGSSKLKQSLNALFERVAARAKDEGAALGERVAAADLLGHDESEAALTILVSLMDPRFPQELQAAAVRSAARLSGAALRRQATEHLVRACAALGPRARGDVLDELLRDPERTGVLLEALKSGEIEPRAIDLNRQRRLLENDDAGLKARAEEIFRELKPDPDRAAVVERYRQALASLAPAGPGGAARGKELYRKHCASCHQIGDEGWAVGPDLPSMRSRAAEALLLDILDPSRAIDPRFTNYAIIERDGSLLNGVITSETPTSIVLRRGEGKSDTILRRDIAELRTTPESLMPAGLEKELSPADLRDLVTFLKG